MKHRVSLHFVILDHFTTCRLRSLSASQEITSSTSQPRTKQRIEATLTSSSKSYVLSGALLNCGVIIIFFLFGFSLFDLRYLRKLVTYVGEYRVPRTFLHIFAPGGGPAAK